MRTYKVIPLWELRRQYHRRQKLRRVSRCYLLALAAGAVIGGVWRAAEALRGLAPSWMDLALWLVPAVIQAGGVWMVVMAVIKLW